MDHCLFIGLMPEENLLKQSDEDQAIVYDHHLTKHDRGFSFNKVWSKTLIDIAIESLRRYHYYANSTTHITNNEISQYNSKWMKHLLELIPDALLIGREDLMRKLLAEIFEHYAASMRSAIMRYIVLCPLERKRLQILVLPKEAQSSSDRSLARGGYSLKVNKA